MVTIRQGVVVRTDHGHRFQTRWSYAIDAHESEVVIEVEAMEHGESHNVAAMAINQIEGSLPLHVRNEGAMRGGSEDSVERTRPAPLSDPLMGRAAEAWNRSIERMDKFRRRLRRARSATTMEVWRD